MSAGPCGPPNATTSTASKGLSTRVLPARDYTGLYPWPLARRSPRAPPPPPVSSRSTSSAAPRWPRWSSSTTRGIGAPFTAPLLHAEWHGWTPTDLIFPFFLFIVGVSITLSSRSATWGSILRRSALIFALGLFLSGYPRFDVSRWRIPGVLARIAVCYLFAASAYRLTAGDRKRQGRSLFFIAIALAVGYWLVDDPRCLRQAARRGICLLRAISAPGSIARVMEGHLYKPRWDPEGLLSTVPAISTTLLGIVAGLWLGSDETPSRKASILAIAGVAGIAVGYLGPPCFRSTRTSGPARM